MYDLALDNSLFINEKLDAALQEIDILFGTENTELIGYSDFGTNFEQFLWQMNPSVESLKSYIIQKINSYTYFLLQFEYSIEVNVIAGEMRNIYEVIIGVKDPTNADNIKIRQYQFR